MAAVRMAVMEIGAQDVIMKVYEIAPRKGMQVIDSLRRMVPVGKDTYSEGRISTQVLEQICNAFTHFKQTLEEYGITEYYALANSAVRGRKTVQWLWTRLRCAQESACVYLVILSSVM